MRTQMSELAGHHTFEFVRQNIGLQMHKQHLRIKNCRNHRDEAWVAASVVAQSKKRIHGKFVIVIQGGGLPGERKTFLAMHEHC